VVFLYSRGNALCLDRDRSGMLSWACPYS